MGGAEFTLKFYKGFYDSADVLAGLEPERKWVLETNKNGFTHLSDDSRASNDYGENFYTVVDKSGNKNYTPTRHSFNSRNQST